MITAVEADQRPGDLSAVVAGALLALLLVAGLGVRLSHISQATFDVHPGRQYHAALVARNYELGGDSSSANIDQRIASAGRAPLIEPPIVETLVAGVWKLTGSEQLWVGGTISSLCWLVGGFWIYALGRRLLSRIAGLVAAVVFVLLPVGVVISRTFMPDPLMVVAIIGACLALVIDDTEQSTRSLVVAAVAGAFALFVKSVAAFYVLPVLFALVVARDGWRGLFRRRSIALAGMVLLPALLWQVYGTFVQHFLIDQAGARLLPDLLTHASFWAGWWLRATVMASVVLIMLAVAGLVVARGRARWVIGAIALGYVAFGFVFTYHYSSHLYYHLPLLVPIGLGIGALVDRLVRLARATRSPLAVGAAAMIVPLLALAVFSWPSPLVGSASSDQLARWADDQAVAVMVGEVTGHSTRVIMLASEDGDLLRYYGWIAGTEWPAAADLKQIRLADASSPPAEQRFRQLSDEPGGADYFVVTALDELSNQPDLQELLDRGYRRVADCDGKCVVWDLSSAKTPG
jgi:MFS family permease